MNWTKFFEVAATPLTVALISFYLPHSIARESINQNYVKMALGIIEKGDEEDRELRLFAVNILEKFSPVPMNDEVKTKLTTNSGLLPKPYIVSECTISWMEKLGKEEKLPKCAVEDMKEMIKYTLEVEAFREATGDK